MVFSSPVFLFAFLPAAFFLILITKKNIPVQNIALSAISLVFYAWGNPAIVMLLLVSVSANYALGLLAGARTDGEKTAGRKVIVIICIVFNVLLLCIFKYANFIVENLNLIPGLLLPKPNIALPIGISFFTFQGMSYVLDINAGRVKAERNPIIVLLYISLFPQLIAGPIVRYGDIAPMLRERRMNARDAAYGLRRFIFGLSKKVLIADAAGLIADAVFGGGAGAAAGAVAGAAAGAVTNAVTNAVTGTVTGGIAAGQIASAAAVGAAPVIGQIACPVAWLGAIAYALQIYYDFSGYSDMAIGLCAAFGFKINENFDYPYAAAGLRDFWRRWHITLSAWFKDYVYIPLGGNRRGRRREALNKLTVFLLTGLWHGASWTFVVWGLFHGFFLTLETYGAVKPDKMPKPVARLYTLLAVVVGFVIFRADTLSSAGRILSSMFVGAAGLIGGAIGGAVGGTAGALGAGGAGGAALALGAGGAAAGGFLGGVYAGSAASQFAQALMLLRPSALPALAVAIVAAFPIWPALLARSQKFQAVGFALSVPLFVLCVLSMSTATYSPFIYYRF